VGDRVLAFSDTHLGCHAEFRSLPQDGLVLPTPPALPDATAAALGFGGTTALDVLRRGRVQRGERVLVNGASGAVGTAVVQLARQLGAEVTGVCSGANIDLVRSLGATHVIDYTRDDFSRNGETYDVIVDTAGTAPFPRCRHSLTPEGRLVMVLAGLPEMLRGAWVSLTTRRRVIAGPAAVKLEDLRRLVELAETGAFQPVIDRIYPFDQIMAAHRYVETGRKKGNVIISVGDQS
jgi:NADPH:quinone reductase-like Zn-dependent oxidoreductase